MKSQLPGSDKDKENQVSLGKLINIARQRGIYLGRGNPINRIRYWTKLGLFPHATRQLQEGTSIITGHYPKSAIELLARIETLHAQGATVEQIKKQLEDDQLFPTRHIIELARAAGVEFGPGDANNRIRYWTKLGLLPHAKRKLAPGQTNPKATEGHYPISILESIQTIDSLYKQGLSAQAIKQYLTEPKIAKPNGSSASSPIEADEPSQFPTIEEPVTAPDDSYEDQQPTIELLEQINTTLNYDILRALKLILNPPLFTQLHKMAAVTATVAFFAIVLTLGMPAAAVDGIKSGALTYLRDFTYQTTAKINRPIAESLWPEIAANEQKHTKNSQIAQKLSEYFKIDESGNLALLKLLPIPKTQISIPDNKIEVPNVLSSQVTDLLKIGEQGQIAITGAPFNVIGDQNITGDLAVGGSFSLQEISLSPENLLKNSSFETNSGQPDHWYYLDQSTQNNTKVTGESIRNGNLALKFTADGATQTPLYLGLAQPLTLTRNGTSYTMTVFVRSNNAQFDAIRLGFWDNKTKSRVATREFPRSSIGQLPSDWIRLTYTMDNNKTPLGKDYYPLIEIVKLTSGTIYVDDSSLTEGSTAPLYAQNNPVIGDGSVVADQVARIYPLTNGIGSLGTSTNKFGALYLKNASIDTDGNLNVNGYATINNDLTVNNNASFKGTATFSGSTVTVNSTLNIGSAGTLQLPDGTAAAPSLAFANDINTGLFREATDTIGFVTGGTERFKLDASGNVLPNVTTTYNLGSTSLRWNKIWAKDADFSDAVTIGGSLTVQGTTLATTGNIETSGNLTVNGNTILGDATSDTLTVTGTTTINLPDNTNPALDIQEGTNNYINISTSDSTPSVLIDLPVAGSISTTANLFTSNVTKTINLGTGTASDTINIGTGATTADDINLGGLATSTIDVLGVTKLGDGGTTDYAQFSSTGDLTFVGSGDTITGPTGGALTVAAGTAQALTLTANNASTWSTSNGLLTITGDDGVTINATSTAGITGNIPDTLADAFDLQQGTSNYLNINTLTEAMQFGNAVTNPTFGFLGTGAVTIAGSAEGTPALTLTAGNLTLTDGDLIVSAGDFSFTGATGVINLSSTLDIDSAGATIDSTTLSIDSTDTTNLTMTANNAADKTLTISSTNVGVGAGLIAISSDGSATLTAGGDINIDTSAGTLYLNNTNNRGINTGSGDFVADTTGTFSAISAATINLGTADVGSTIQIGTNSTTADTITIGNSNASTTLALTGGDDWSVTTGGTGTFTNLVLTSGNISDSDSAVTINDDLTITTGTTISAASITIFNCTDCIDFDDLENTLDIDETTTINSTATTTTPLSYLADSLTQGTGLLFSFDGLTTGKGIDLTSTSNAIDSGVLFNVSQSASAATDTTLSADTANISFSPIYSTAVTTPSITGQVLDISRSTTTNNLFVSTLTVSGAVVSISDTGTQTTGTLTHSGDVLALTQNYGTTTGAILSLTPPSTTNAGGTLEAINIGTITTSSGTDLALTFGTGWDTDINATTSLEIGIGGTNQLTLTDGALAGTTDNDIDLGTSSSQFKDFYIQGDIIADTATDIDIDDNTASAFTITAGADTYFLITTLTGAEVVTLNNVEAGIMNIGTTNVTRTLNLATGTGADTINIGTGGTTADAIALGNTGVATTIDVNSGAATVNAIDIATDSVSSANALALSANALTSGTAVAVSSTATSFNGELLTLSKTATTGSTAFTSDLANITYSQTFDGGIGLDSTGNVLDISRAITISNAAQTHTVSGALVTIADSGTETAGDINNTSNVLRLAQNCGTGVTCSGAVLKIANSGTGADIALDNDETITNSTNGTIAFGADKLTLSTAAVSGNLLTASYAGAATQTGALLGIVVDTSTNVTVPNTASGNQTGLALTIKDGGTSATAVGIALNGTYDRGIDFSGGTVSAGGSIIYNDTSATIDLAAAADNVLEITNSAGTTVNDNIITLEIDANTDASDKILFRVVSDVGGTELTKASIDSDGDFVVNNVLITTDITCTDCLDFTDFEDTLDLDNNLTLNQTAYTWDQTFTGDTTVGLTYTANSLTTGTALRLTSSGTITTGGELLDLVGNGITSGNVITASSTALTSGSLLSFTGPSGGTVGVTGNIAALTSDVGNAGSIINSTATFDSTAVAANSYNTYLSTTNSNSTNANSAYGLYSTLSDAVALANTDYGLYSTVTNTGANTLGTKNVYGVYGTASNTTTGVGGTANTYGGYFSSTGDTGGTSTAYGVYASALGADTNYGIQVAAMTGATSTGLDIGNLSGATANTGINIGTLGTATTSKGVVIGALSSATSTGVDIGAFTGATTNTGINITSFATGTTSKGLVIGTNSSATATGVDLGALSGGTANIGVKVGAISGTGTGTGVDIGAFTNTGATQYGVNIGAFSGTHNGGTTAGVNIGNISSAGTTTLNYGILLGTLTGGTTSNYQISTGALTKVASATNAQLNLGAVSGDAASSTNYGINMGAVSGTGTANYGLHIGAVSGATTNISLAFAKENAHTMQIVDTTTTNTAGGALTIKSAAGLGTTATAAGGAFTLQSGAGGALSATASTAGAGGLVSITGADGGATSGVVTGATVGGAGGGITLAAGTGGAAAGGTTTNTGGAGGAITIAAGNAGTGGNANGGTLTLNSGAVTGSGTSTLNLGTSNSTVLNIGDSTVTKTIDIGGVTSSAADTINIATEGTLADVITIGNSLATTTLALTGGDDWSITTGGAVDFNGSAAIGDGGDSILLSGTTITLTANTSGNDITLNLTDNNADALDIQEGSSNYINVGTLDAGAAMSFGNATTNPTFGFLGTGLITIAGAGAETNSLTLTTGNITLTDGDLTVSSGEIAATSDDATGTNFSFTTGALTTGTGLGITASAVMTTGSALSVSSATYVHTALNDIGNLVSLAFTDASTNANNGGVTNGINIASTINTSGAGTKNINAINIASPTKTACTTGACTWTGLAVADPGTLANTTFYAATFAGGNVGIGTTSPSEVLQLGDFVGNNDEFILLATTGDGTHKNGIKMQHLSSLYGFDIVNSDVASGNLAVGLNFIRHENDATGANALFIARATGNVGIGTTGPAGLLDVNNTTTKTITAGANARVLNIQGAFTEATSGTHARIMGVEITPPTITNGAGTEVVTDTASLYISAAPTATVTGGNYTLWVDAGTSRFNGQILSELGSESAPGYSFVSSGTADGDTGIFSTGADILNLGAGGVEFITLNETTQDELIINDDGDDIDFRIEASGVTNAFFVQGSDGNVGIGTASPDYNLEVETTGAEIFAHYTGQSRGGIKALSTQRLSFMTTVSGDDLVFGYADATPADDGSDFTEVMRIDNGTSRVGIGTTGPQYALDIVGNSALWQSVYGTDDGLVGYWPFSEGTGTKAYDRSPYGKDGTITAGAGGWTTGKYGNAYNFDGSATYVDVGDFSSLANTITVEAWVKPDTAWTTASLAVGEASGTFGGLGAGWTASKLRYYIRTATEWQNTPDSVTTIVADTWYHLVGTYDKDGGTNNLKLYVNGVLDSQTTVTTGAMTISGTVAIGRAAGGGSTYFDGKVDEVRIYNRAISADEVKTHYLRGANNTAVAMQTSTTAGSLYGLRGVVTDTGIVTTGTDTTYGSRLDVTRTGATGGTINTYGQYIALTADDAGSGTSSSYGLYVDTSGSSADNNYGAYFSGNVGIGTTAPGAKLQIDPLRVGTQATPLIVNALTSAAVGEAQFWMSNVDTATSVFRLMFGSGNGTRIAGVKANNNAGRADLIFETYSSGTGNLAERMTIDTSGNVSIAGLVSCNTIDTNSSGVLACGADAGAKFERFTTTGAGATYTKPAGAILVQVVAVGAGGGGGSGRGAAQFTIRSGGGGGGGGVLARKTFDAANVGTTETVIAGTGGAGGISVSSGTTANGNAGDVGGNSTFGSLLTAYGGGGGGGGSNSNGGGGGGGGGTNGAGNSGTISTSGAGGAPTAGLTGVNQTSGGGAGGGNLAVGGNAEYGGGGGGGGGNNGSIGLAGGSSIYGAPGGGGGGGVTSLDAESNGAAGGTRPSYASGGGGGGGTAPGGAGTAGTASTSGPGSAGGGGAGKTDTGSSGGNGGDGGIPGAGGGGGAGASTVSTGTSGAGGAGARGEVLVWTVTGGTGADLAEVYYSLDMSLEAADVVAADPNLPGIGFKKSDKAYDGKVLGIMSTKPGLVLGDEEAPDLKGKTAKPVMLALAGRVPVKVSTEGGPIEVGDYLTSSSVPGVAMKATKAGPTVGKALEAFNPDTSGTQGQALQGKIVVFVNLSWYDPDVFLTDTGELHLTATDSASLVDKTKPTFKIHNLAEQLVERIGVFSQSIIANLQAGLVQAQQLIAEKVQITGKLVSPEIETTLIVTNGKDLVVDLRSQTDSSQQTATSSGQLATSRFGKLLIQGDMSVSGQLTADGLNANEATIAGTLRAQKIIASQIEGFEATSTAQYITNITNIIQEATPSAVPDNNLAISTTNLTAEGYVKAASLQVDTATFNESINVLGRMTGQNLAIVETFTVGGTLAVDHNSLSVLGDVLYMQNHPLSKGLDILAGKVKIDEYGNITTIGTITADKVVTKELAIINPEPTATSSGQLAQSIPPSKKSIGTAVITQGQSTVSIETSAISNSSRIFITPTVAISQPLAVTTKEVGQGFTVSIANPENKDVGFEWLIVNEQAATNTISNF